MTANFEVKTVIKGDFASFNCISCFVDLETFFLSLIHRYKKEVKIA